MSHPSNRKGFTLIAAGACVFTLFGMLGLALDLGRVYITRNEAQSFTDTAALAAALALNGVSFAPAHAAIARNTRNQWNLGTSIFSAAGSDTTITTEFARPQAANDFRPDESTWSTAPASAAGYTFVRVTATATLPLYILPVVGTGASQTVASMSVAGQVPLNNFNSGLLPFSPIQHSSAAAAHPPFGLVVGQWYTLRYPGGARFTENDLCPGDKGDPAFLDLINLQVSDQRGFYQNPEASVARDEIISGVMERPVTFPGTIWMAGGAMNTAMAALNTRIDYDTDNVSTTFDEYQANLVNGERVGNGFRLVGAPINFGPADDTGGDREIVGFGGFFLSNSSTDVYYSGGGGSPWCAQYYGVWVKGGQGQGAGKPGLAYVAVLVQ
jgi:hypothetical protein